ncbi:MAG TPA: DUF2269 family protein [Acidimicrobiia bacterium]|jgi:uncharacterized membrane protein
MYDLLVLIHILSAMVWVGGGFVLVAVERHAFNTGGHEGLDRTMRALEWTDDWIFTPAPLLVVATGVTMVIVNDAWAFSQSWIYLALGLIVVEFVTGFRELNRIKAARESGSVSSPEYGVALKAYLRFAPFAVSLLGVIVVLMVFKPGA